ncbi:hypothetical protein SDC9_68149 [bioreactor metagenome]|uniref:Uncharacterized protein n=1 Tax=bioreactor metagenome TaxID=1076179 RepID=A0A644Y698_9ZZZZ
MFWLQLSAIPSLSIVARKSPTRNIFRECRVIIRHPQSILQYIKLLTLGVLLFSKSSMGRKAAASSFKAKTPGQQTGCTYAKRLQNCDKSDRIKIAHDTSAGDEVLKDKVVDSHLKQPSGFVNKLVAADNEFRAHTFPYVAS